MNIKKSHLVVIFSLFLVLLIVCFSCNNKEGYVSSTVTGPQGNTLVINDDDEAVAVITDDDVYVNDNALDNFDEANIDTYYGRYGNNVTVAKGPAGNTAVSANVNNPPYSSDYILKSQVVPPVCPACPSLVAAANGTNDDNNNSDDTNGDDTNGDDTNGDDTNGDDTNGNSTNGDSTNGNSTNGDTTNGDDDDTCTNESCYQGNTYKREVNVKCPPCPPCARCPEPAFDCKRVPVYRESDDRYLPRPILSDFSTFGM